MRPLPGLTPAETTPGPAVIAPGENAVARDRQADEKPSGPRSRKGTETRARLVAAAKEVFEEDGFLEARVSDIADRAGLSHGSFYHYFGSKEEVFREVAAAVDERLSSPLSGVIHGPGSSPQERIRNAIRQHLEIYREESRIMGVIEQVSRFDTKVGQARFDRHRHYLEQMAASIASLQRRGVIDPALDPRILAAGCGSMTYRFPEMWFVQGLVECDFDTGVEQLTRLFLRAIGLPDDAPVTP